MKGEADAFARHPRPFRHAERGEGSWHGGERAKRRKGKRSGPDAQRLRSTSAMPARRTLTRLYDACLRPRAFRAL